MMARVAPELCYIRGNVAREQRRASVTVDAARRRWGGP
jgi:hypothetical protein